MRKKILNATFAVAIMAVAGYNIHMNQPKIEMSELALANIEALAEVENPNCPNGCLSTYGLCFCNGHQPYEEKDWGD